jgi:hypothetical protein
MSDEGEEQTIAEALQDIETRPPDLEATLLARHPELQVEEEQFVDAQEVEAQGDFSRRITTTTDERNGGGDGTITRKGGQGGVRRVRVELLNPVSEQAMRDGIVVPGVHSKHTNEIIHFAAWVRTDREDWLTQYGKDNFDALDLERKNEGINARQKRVKEGWMAMLSNARNVPIFNVDAFNATAVMDFVSRQSNQTTGKPLSKEMYRTKRCCIRYLVRCHNGKGFSAEFEAEVATLWRGFTRVTTKRKKTAQLVTTKRKKTAQQDDEDNADLRKEKKTRVRRRGAQKDDEDNDDLRKEKKTRTARRDAQQDDEDKDDLRKAYAQLTEKVYEKVIGGLKNYFEVRKIGGGEMTEARVREMIAAGCRQENAEDLLKKIGTRPESLETTKIPIIGTAEKRATELQRNEQPQGQDTSVLRTNHRLGQITRLPDDFQFPSGNAYDCWLQWNLGNAVRQIPPLRLVQLIEFQRVLDANPKADAETRARRGLHKGKKRPTRKTSCDMKYLCTYIEKKASEAGLDTSDRRLDNIRRMFEAAGNVGAGSANPRKN